MKPIVITLLNTIITALLLLNVAFWGIAIAWLFGSTHWALLKPIAIHTLCLSAAFWIGVRAALITR